MTSSLVFGVGLEFVLGEGKLPRWRMMAADGGGGE